MTVDQSVLEKIRSIRMLQSPRLKPSPFLRESYEDPPGNLVPVVLRDYQKQGVMNLLMVTRMVLGDDTGLGKTIEILTTIGYVWLVEPGFIPLVVVKKSALYQWAAEARKFMKDMEVIVVDGEPYERDATYASFFGQAVPGRRQIAVLTYETVLKDATPGVVRDRSVKPSKQVKAGLKAARDAKAGAEKAFREARRPFMESLSVRRGPEALFYADRVLKKADPDAPMPDRPIGWTAADDAALAPVLDLFRRTETADAELQRWRDLEAPPMATPGVVERVSEMLRKGNGTSLMLILDEVHAVKDYRGKLHKSCRTLADLADRVIGMTATPVKNRLMEFFSVFRVVYPDLFPMVSHFMKAYCHVKMQAVKGGGKVPVVVGHSNEQLEAFRTAVEPYYLSRRKHEVAKELPELITRELECRLSPEQEELYDEAEGLALDDDAKSDNAADILRSLVRVQEACDAPQLILDEEGGPHEGVSCKLESLVDILEEQPDTKVLVFCLFERMVTIIEERLKKEGIRCVRITGAEPDPKKRERAKNLYQDRESGVNVMLITTAGSESINLQSTEHIVAFDTPWSWGDYVQLTGRAVRIGSVNVTVLVTHLVARRAGGRKTIDDYKIAVLKEKKRIADRTAGEALKDGLSMSDAALVTEVFEIMVRARAEGAEGKVLLRDKARETKAASRKPKPGSRKASAAAPPPPTRVLKIVDLDLGDL